MRIFFTGSQRGRAKYGAFYKDLQQILEEAGVEYISPQSHTYQDVLGKKFTVKLSQDDIHYLFITKGIEQSDAVIIEASMDTFRLGHEATLSLIYNKPVLCLSQHRDYSEAIKHPVFYADLYRDRAEMKIAVLRFLTEVESKHLSIRFNGMMSPRQKSFLEWLSMKESKSLSEVIRELIDNRMGLAADYEQDFSWLSKKYLKDNDKSN